MTGRPALTLLHMGPGLANGVANLHNARRARSPVVNLVGGFASGPRVHETDPDDWERLEVAWDGRYEPEMQAARPFPSLPAPLTHMARGRPHRDQPRLSSTLPLVVGWALFGVAFGLGLLVGLLL